MRINWKTAGLVLGGLMVLGLVVPKDDKPTRAACPEGFTYGRSGKCDDKTCDWFKSHTAVDADDKWFLGTCQDHYDKVVSDAARDAYQRAHPSR